MSLSAQEIAFRYQSQWVLEELSIDAAAGEVLGILGPNGCGKTTLLRALSRLIRPQVGSVMLGDQELWNVSGSASAQRIAIAPQSEKRDWPLTVLDAVRLGRAPHRGWFMPLTAEDHTAVEQALEETGLGDVRDQPITQLSGGQWRRMILARALAQRAEVLLLDEPTAGLDLKYQASMLDLVQKLAHEHQLTIVLTLHDLNLAAVYCDRVALLAEGTIHCIGRPREVLTEDHIHSVFGIQVAVLEHPVYKTPLVAPLIKANEPPE